MSIIKFKARKNIYSSKQICRYVLTDKGQIEHPFALPILLQNINRLELDTIHRDFLDNHKHAKKRKNGNALLHEIVTLHKDDVGNNKITLEMSQDIMETYIRMRGAEKALVIGKSHNNGQHYHFIIGNNEYRSAKSLRMSHNQMKDLLRRFELWHKAKYPMLTKSIVHTTPEREQNRNKSRDIASENRNNRREKEYAMKMRTPGKKSHKELAFEMTETLLQRASNFSQLVGYIKQIKDLGVYTYRGKIRGILYQERKYTFSTLGISKERLLPLERHKKRLKELQLIKEMHKKTREKSQDLER